MGKSLWRNLLQLIVLLTVIALLVSMSVNKFILFIMGLPGEYEDGFGMKDYILINLILFLVYVVSIFPILLQRSRKYHLIPLYAALAEPLLFYIVIIPNTVPGIREQLDIEFYYFYPNLLLVLLLFLYILINPDLSFKRIQMQPSVRTVT